MTPLRSSRGRPRRPLRALAPVTALLGALACGQATPAGDPAKSEASPATPANPCASAADKLIELSLIQGKAIGREWGPEKQEKKRRQFIERCEKELPTGAMTLERLACVERSTTIDAAQECLDAPKPPS